MPERSWRGSVPANGIAHGALMAKPFCTPAQLPDGRYACTVCGFGKTHDIRTPFHKNCENTPAAIEARAQQETQVATAAERLGIRPAHSARYAKALLRWSLARWPRRTDAEVARIHAEHCEPCDEYVDGRCKKCGCAVVSKGMVLVNKIKMQTEKCPLKKW
jgi:hypothetical protein